MPTTLAISFPWGMYHATPWGRNVNEGVVEWPPSPWRLLRALYATWKERAPHLDEVLVHELLGQLATLPEYRVPPFVETHTRHYMPDLKHRPGVQTSTDKVLDAFVVTHRDARVGVSWPVDLDDRLRGVLAELTTLLPYLGRAESICQAQLLEPDEVIDGIECTPVQHTSSDAPIRLLAPMEPLEVGALVARTSDVRKRGNLDPAGTRWVEYSPLEELRPQRAMRVRRSPKVEVLRWSVVDDAPRPSIKSAVAMADSLRRAAMSVYGRDHDGGVSPVLAGKDAEGMPLRGHQHAHYFALDLDQDRLIDTLVLWAPEGMDDDVLGSLDSLVHLTGDRRARDLRSRRIGLEGVGDVSNVVPELVGESARVWVSHTPFSPPRHGRRRQPWDDHVVNEVRRELKSRGLPEPREVRVLRGHGDWLDFRRHRLTERLEDARRAIGVEIEFDTPLEVPLALGSLCHFGLGVFLPRT